MSLQGTVLIDVVGIGFILLILNLIRMRKLHVGYAAMWFLAALAPMLIVSVPPLLDVLPAVMGAIYPASALSLLAFVFIFFVLIFFSVQLSVLSARQIALIQAMAVNERLTQDMATETGNPTKPA